MPNTKSVDELLEEIYVNATAQFQTVEPYDYWIIGDQFLCEPWVGGMQIDELFDGELFELKNLDLSDKKILNLTQDEFDNLMYAFYFENGYFPNT
jgi:hypothetical protein